YDARSAALMQSDVQATLRNTKTNVLVMRPIMFELASFARGISGVLGKTKISLGRVDKRFQP
ncbi:MAG: hypothetical protein ACRETL_06035, partial [Gammaproteobacteria bacterium]